MVDLKDLLFESQSGHCQIVTTGMADGLCLLLIAKANFFIHHRVLPINLLRHIYFIVQLYISVLSWLRLVITLLVKSAKLIDVGLRDCSQVYHYCIRPSRSNQLSLAIPPWVCKMSTSDGYGFLLRKKR